jgi:hypothetical protein
MFHHICSLTGGTVNRLYDHHRRSFPGLDVHDTASPLICIDQGGLRKSTNLGHYLTTFDTWLDIQNGAAAGQDHFDAQRRYIRNGRDLGQYVHVDALSEAYLNARLILLGWGAPVDPGNPYTATTKQDAFSTWGGPHILSLVTEVATRALKAVWYQK